MSTIIRYVALSGRVIVVATKGDIGDWAAYIDAVAGFNHDKEAIEVALYGDKLQYELAKIIFPDIDTKLSWRS